MASAKRASRQVEEQTLPAEHSSSHSEESSGADLEAFRQSQAETSFGGKYLGQMRREFDGKFGSLPLYDDYDDESEA